jgi:type I site-specific restriction endonuclease
MLARMALVEAKATRHSALKGQQQAKLYADFLAQMTGQRPIIFCSNGYGVHADKQLPALRLWIGFLTHAIFNAHNSHLVIQMI